MATVAELEKQFIERGVSPNTARAWAEAEADVNIIYTSPISNSTFSSIIEYKTVNTIIAYTDRDGQVVIPIGTTIVLEKAFSEIGVK